MKHIYDDGGRVAAGFKGHAGDCVCRAIVIASGRPYREVYDALAKGNAEQRITRQRGAAGKRTARAGINTGRKWFKDYMTSLGFVWTPTMKIGSGCKVHLTDSELPAGRLVVSVSKHLTAVIDGVIRDTHDPQREINVITPDCGQPIKPGETKNINGICSVQRRCVYGYWTFQPKQAAPIPAAKRPADFIREAKGLIELLECKCDTASYGGYECPRCQWLREVFIAGIV